MVSCIGALSFLQHESKLTYSQADHNFKLASSSSSHSVAAKYWYNSNTYYDKIYYYNYYSSLR